ncbi:MAG TPA: NAD(P)-dependent alcohol dehydrogenase [Sphingomicrobium sp.]|nr:NAD(P)-dependent alcohol dehydrogenase [Sphingomicrobium sp.]
MATQAKAWGTKGPHERLEPMAIERRDLRPEDVSIKISHCGICHSDVHFANDDWGMSLYPMVPGHEIVGTVNAVGSAVGKYMAGDRVAVGCLVDSCRTCEQCQSGEEQFCNQMPTFTYSGKDRQSGEITKGGYSSQIVVREEFVCRWPDNLDMGRGAPLLCAGITTYSPLRRFGAGPGKKVGVAGLGGLGHLAVKFAAAMGAQVTMITTSPEKGEDARGLGADDVLLSNDLEVMASAANRFDLIVNTIPVTHNVGPYLDLLKANGVMVIVGAIDELPGLHGGALVMRNRVVAGSLIGGLPETQEMLDFCAEHRIQPETEFIRIDEVNHAWDRMLKGDVRYRFVIDMDSLNEAQ